MNDKIKEIVNGKVGFVFNHKDRDEILDLITDLQKINKNLTNSLNKKAEEGIKLQQENERLKKISHKMHLWIFLHCGDEQKVYDELGLTDEENAMLGYSGQFRMGSEKSEKTNL